MSATTISIPSRWPWPALTPSTPLPLNGDIDAAAACLGVSPATLVQISQLLCAGLPFSGKAKADWIADEADFALVVDDADIRMMQTFGRDDDGRLFVEFKLLALESALQNKTLTKTALRNAAIVYDHLKVDYCIAYANFDIGGYAWAKLGAAAQAPETCRVDLKRRLATLQTTYSAEELDHLDRLLSDAAPQDLMFEVACATLDGQRPLGKPMLMGYMWNAIWRVTDSSQRSRIAGALS